MFFKIVFQNRFCETEIIVFMFFKNSFLFFKFNVFVLFREKKN